MRVLRSRSRVVRPLAALAVLSLAGCSGLVTAFGGGMSDELRQKGVSAPAQILEIWDTGWTVNDNPVIGMKVRVRPSDRPPFEATIEKTTISRIAIPQFQPGNALFVRFDPNNPKEIAVDFEGPAQPAVSTGNPYRDRFVPATNLGAGFLPPPPVPRIYLGTGDSGADAQALYENDYALLGASGVGNAPGPQQALDHGKEIGAALVVVYGRFFPAPGLALDVLPFRRRPVGPEQAAAGVPAAAGPMALAAGLGPDDQVAAYWGKTRPAILGIVSRPLNEREQAQLRRVDGIVVEGVANGSPAAAAGIVAGDVLVSMGGKAVPDVHAVPAFVTSFAGQKVIVDLIRGGSPLSVTVQLNPASP